MMGIVSKLAHSQHVHYAEPMHVVLPQALQTKRELHTLVELLS